jgi:ATP-dependent DNA ligase
LQLRLHPAASRVAKLASATPAMFMGFDCLAVGARELAEQPLSKRRGALETLFGKFDDPRLRLSPSTRDRDKALGWLERTGGALDGVVAKRLDQPYAFGERAMVKVKATRSADCVVGGFRYASKSKEVGSLLLGLYDADGKLDHVGFTSALKSEDKPALTKRLEGLAGGPGFTGKAPGGPSRWSNARSADWVPLKPELVVEVRYDQVTGGRFRHGTALLRWRPDKAPRQCTRKQLAPPLTPSQLAALMR